MENCEGVGLEESEVHLNNIRKEKYLWIKFSLSLSLSLSLFVSLSLSLTHTHIHNHHSPSFLPCFSIPRHPEWRKWHLVLSKRIPDIFHRQTAISWTNSFSYFLKIFSSYFFNCKPHHHHHHHHYHHHHHHPALSSHNDCHCCVLCRVIWQ